MKNIFGWMQLTASDPQKAKAFYSQLFKWSFDSKTKKEGATYIEIDAGEGLCAGIDQGETKEESRWVPFVNVNDIHEYTEKAKKLGAQVIVPVTDIGGGKGFYSVFVDPTGAVLGLWGPK